MNYPETAVDVLIVGAGISGIGAAYHLKTKCPNKTFAIVERRSSFGGSTTMPGVAKPWPAWWTSSLDSSSALPISESSTRK